MHSDWIKQLSESYIQMNEIKAYINTDDKSVLQSLKRDDIHVAAELALGNPKHWIHQQKHAEIKTALINFKNKNAQQEDLRNIVKFMQMDPKYTEFEVQQAFDR
jgi:hypothetical protein